MRPFSSRNIQQITTYGSTHGALVTRRTNVNQKHDREHIVAIFAWVLDIAGFVLFLATDSITMWGGAVGLCVMSACVAQAGLSTAVMDADGDGDVTGEELKGYMALIQSCSSARNSAISSVVIIGIWGALTHLV